MQLFCTGYLHGLCMPCLVTSKRPVSKSQLANFSEVCLQSHGKIYDSLNMAWLYTIKYITKAFKYTPICSISHLVYKWIVGGDLHLTPFPLGPLVILTEPHCQGFSSRFQLALGLEAQAQCAYVTTHEVPERQATCLRTWRQTSFIIKVGSHALIHRVISVDEEARACNI